MYMTRDTINIVQQTEHLTTVFCVKSTTYIILFSPRCSCYMKSTCRYVYDHYKRLPLEGDLGVLSLPTWQERSPGLPCHVTTRVYASTHARNSSSKKGRSVLIKKRNRNWTSLSSSLRRNIPNNWQLILQLWSLRIIHTHIYTHEDMWVGKRSTSYSLPEYLDT